MSETCVIGNCSGDKFISKDLDNKFIFVSDKEKALRFNKKSALNVMINNLTKFGNLRLYEIEDKNESKYQIDYIEEKSNEEIKEYVNLNMKYDLNIIVDVLDNLPAKLENEKIKLNNQLIRISRALTDITHYKELKPKRSASAKCNLDTFETKLLLKRRETKDNLFLIDCALERIKGKNRDIKMENRNYVPRELNGLFLDNEIPNFEEWWDK